MKLVIGLVAAALAAWAGPAFGQADEALRQQAIEAMSRATTFFTQEIATEGGYLWQYKDDLSMREGEGVASETTVWVQPPGTPAIGLVFLDAFAATRDSTYFRAARHAADALAWGQLASGGWDYRIDFDPEGSRRWYTRRDVLAGSERGERQRNTSVYDDNTSQSAMRLLMRVDQALGFNDPGIHGAVEYGLNAMLKSQYANGAWPQRYDSFPDPTKHAPMKARYPETWPREWPDVDYRDFYTFNDNAMADVMDVMLEAHRIYGNDMYRAAAIRCGEFMLNAQMPDPQPTWAQQYNHRMEPAWARRFEPASVTGGESFGVMRALIGLTIETGDTRFVKTIPRALAWAKRVRLPDGRLARFYELKTDRPLYFVRDTYELTYSDADMPTHYAFKVGGGGIESVAASLVRLEKEGAAALRGERRVRWPGSITEEDRAAVRAAIEAMDARGRWVEPGQMRVARSRDRVDAMVISCRTFVRNMRAMTRFVALTK